MRPKTYAGGSRQKLWDALRRGPASTGTLITVAGSTRGAVDGYLDGLRRNGYVASENGDHTLITNSGPRAPSWNATTSTLHDWNLQPGLSPVALRQLWTASGLSMNAYGKAIGLSESQGTRLKQMMDGSRPISPAVEDGALAYAAKPK